MVSATQSRGISSMTVTPEQISSILLADGNWHTVKNCEFTQFAVAIGQSEPQPNKVFPALVYMDESNKEVTTPLSHILSYQTKDSYRNNAR